MTWKKALKKKLWWFFQEKQSKRKHFICFHQRPHYYLKIHKQVSKDEGRKGIHYERQAKKNIMQKMFNVKSTHAILTRRKELCITENRLQNVARSRVWIRWSDFYIFPSCSFYLLLENNTRLLFDSLLRYWPSSDLLPKFIVIFCVHTTNNTKNEWKRRQRMSEILLFRVKDFELCPDAVVSDGNGFAWVCMCADTRITHFKENVSILKTKR